MTPSLSVVLCTFNGARYLPALLGSLAAQHELPDELIVSDDGSTDDTCRLIADFAQHAPFSVKRLHHEIRSGAAAHFVATARHARSQWIAFCDQDDIWHPHKLAAMRAASKQHPVSSAVFCNARLVDSRGQASGQTLWKHVRYTPAEQKRLDTGHAWEVLVKHPVVCGAGLMIHARVRDHLSPIPDDWMHDAWAALIAAGIGPVIGISAPLFDYRQHDNNLIGASRKSLRQQWETFQTFDRRDYLQSECARWEALAKRLQSLPSSLFQEATSQAVAEKIRHLAFRKALPSLRRQRYPSLVREYRSGNYQRFTKGWRPLFADLLLR